jgi:hypothetical protein
MNARVTALEEHRIRSRRIDRVRAMQAMLRGAAAEDAAEREAVVLAAADRARGRAWINGREVGGTDPLYRHLTESYD